MQRPSVSVVIPCYNVAPYVSEAIESALNQTYPIDEIVCVDDGSTDGTLEVLRRYESDNSRITVLIGPNRGGNHARNRGLQHVTADYVQFLDADDVLDSEKVEVQVQRAEKESDRVDLVVGGLCEAATYDPRSVILPGQTLPILDLARSALGRTSSNLFRRETVLKVGAWNVAWKSSQEYELMFRILSNGGNVVYSPDALTWVRKREGSLTENEDVSRFERMVALRADILRHAQGSNKYDAFVIAQLEQTLFGAIRMLGFRSLGAAEVAHSRHIPKGFQPDPIRFNKLYVQTYRLFGFTMAERIRGLVNSLLRKS